MNLKNFVNIGGELKTNHRIYSYVNDAEYISMDDMLADGFFNEAFGQLKVDDKILVYDSTSYETLTVTSIDNGVIKTKKLDANSGGGDAKIDAQDLDTSNVGTTGQVLSKTDTGMEWVDQSGGGGLPDQIGHTGFLQTDGTNATWSDKPAIENIAPDIIDHHNMCASYTKFQNTGWGMTAFGVNAFVQNMGTVVGYKAYCYGDSVAIGANSYASSNGVAIGYSMRANKYSVAIGHGADIFPGFTNCVFLGRYTNGNLDSVQDKGFYWGTGIWNEDIKKYLTYKLFDGTTGFIVPERLAALPTEEGNYVLKATVAADGTVTTTWVKES